MMDAFSVLALIVGAVLFAWTIRNARARTRKAGAELARRHEQQSGPTIPPRK